jgi:glycerophosphoryl diester phosphodiesterase
VPRRSTAPLRNAQTDSALAFSLQPLAFLPMVQSHATPDAAHLLATKHPVLIGHRGYASRAPENTLPSFKLAIAAGADLVELDYQVSADGVPMAIHDRNLKRTTDARRKWRRSRLKVSERTAAEIQALDAGIWFGREFAGTRVPLLTEALDWILAAGSVPLIERKSGDAAACARLLRERNLVNRVIVMSFDWSFLRELHALEPKQVLGALGPPSRVGRWRRHPRISRKLGSSWLAKLEKTGAQIAVWNRRVSKRAIQLAHRRGLKVWVYTVDAPKAAARLLANGVDGLITNKIDTVRKAAGDHF